MTNIGYSTKASDGGSVSAEPRGEGGNRLLDYRAAKTSMRVAGIAHAQ